MKKTNADASNQYSVSGVSKYQPMTLVVGPVIQHPASSIQ